MKKAHTNAGESGQKRTGRLHFKEFRQKLMDKRPAWMRDLGKNIACHLPAGVRKIGKKRGLIILAVLLVLFAVHSMFFAGGVEVSTEKTEKQEFEDSFKESGIYSTGKTTDIISVAGGAVKSVNVQKDAQVKQGDVIAVIDSTDYESAKKSHESMARSYTAEAENEEKTEEYNRQDMNYSLNELKAELQDLENTRKQTDIESVTKTAPSVYVSTLEVEMKTAQNALTTAERNFTNAQTLFAGGDISQDEYSSRQTEYENAKLACQKAKEEYDTAKASLDQLKKSGKTDTQIDREYFQSLNVDADKEIEKTQIQISALENKMKNDYASSMAESYRAQAESEKKQAEILDKKIIACTITAPEDGIITALPIDGTSHIEEGAAVAAIKAAGEAYVESSVLTTAAPYLKEGDPVQLIQKLKGGDRTYPGHIKKIYDYAEKTTSALGLDEYRITVRCTLDDAAAEMKDGYSFDVQFYAYPPAEDVISVPNSALFKENDEYYLFTDFLNHARKTKVSVGYKGSSRTEILSGLSAGDRIIVNANAEDLTDGAGISELEE